MKKMLSIILCLSLLLSYGVMAVSAADGELVVEYDDNGIPRLKVGDGATPFSELPYILTHNYTVPAPAHVTLDVNKWVKNPDNNRYYQEVEIKDYKEEKITVSPNAKSLYSTQSLYFPKVISAKATVIASDNIL